MRIICILIALLFCTPAYADGHWHGGGWGGGWHGGWGWHGHGGYGGGDNGLLGGIIGGTIGSVIGNAIAPPPVVVAPPVIVAPPELQAWTPAWYTYCAQRYRSFNAQTGYYTGYDGRPYFCQ